MYHRMSWNELLAITANPNDYSEYDRRCAIYSLNHAIDYNRILIKQYKDMINLIIKVENEKD